MIDEETEFIPLDGVYIKRDKVLTMARKCGNYLIAEHYLMPVLFYTTPMNKQWIDEEVNKIRSIYSMMPYSPLRTAPASANNMPNFVPMKKTPADVARESYRKLSLQERYEVLKEALSTLKANHGHLFSKQACWIGIYLVVRDRLDGSIKKDAFFDFAVLCTPEDWKDAHRIKKTTMSNFAREIKDSEDREQAYYDMMSNPFEELCNKFWDILQEVILTGY